MPAPSSSPPAPEVDVIANRLAKRLAGGGDALRGLRDLVATSGGRVALHETRSLADLDRTIDLIKARGTRCVVFVGGDGTYLSGTTALCRAFGDDLPSVGFAPGGTVCTVARNWGVLGRHATYAERLVASVLDTAAQVQPRPTLRVRDDVGGDRVGFIFGAGLVASFFDAYYDSPSPGLVHAAGLVARIFAGAFVGGTLAERVLRPVSGTLSIDGVAQSSAAWSLVAASVVKDLGLHMRLLHRAGERHDAFHAVASALPPRRLAPRVGRVLAGAPLGGAGHVDTLAKALELTLDDVTRTSYVLDGERFRAARVLVTPGPVLRYVSLGRRAG